MRSRLKEIARKEFTRHPVAYCLAMFMFIVGGVSGIYYYHYIGIEKVPNYLSCLDGYISYIANGNADRWGIFLNSFYRNVQTLFLLALCGLNPVFFAFSPVLIIGRGFVFGFTVTVLICVLGWSGLPVLFLGILPQYLIFIPLLLYTWILCYSRISDRLKGPRRPRRFMPDARDKDYVAVLFIEIVLCALIAGYLALVMPAIMNGVYGFIKSYI